MIRYLVEPTYSKYNIYKYDDNDPKLLFIEQFDNVIEAIEYATYLKDKELKGDSYDNEKDF